jgi:Zn-dependent M16 (insulinase) family peptidase
MIRNRSHHRSPQQTHTNTNVKMSTYRKSIAGAGAGADAALSSSENRPIILTNSEDDMEIDTSEVEIDKIATKYMKRRSTERTKRMIVFISTLIMIFSLTTFVFIRSMKSRSVARGSKGRSKHGHNDYINDPNHPNRKIQVPKHNAFTLVKSKFLPGYQASIHLYQHTKTQAEFIAYRPMDTMQDKAFGISFRTKPTSNNGVAHILEHSVLSGSKNYPAKDPFLHLLKGSLHTFLNAMTYNDRTVYPVASRNSKDFKNLMSVYLDAVFYPNCVQEDGEWILKQEGWRYEPIEDGDDDDKKENVVVHLNSDGTTETRKRLEVKGVVYSEMKGVFSNPESIIYRHSDKLLFPDNTYFHDSGGEPKEIPTLTHTEFVDFYNRHYHPTNSKIFVSGTLDDIESAMEIIDSGYLSKYDLNVKIKNESQIQFQKKNFGHHLYQSIPYAVAEETPDEGQHLLLITWLLNDDFFKTQMLELAFYVLDYLLIGTMSSPLNKVLMESDLGSNVIGGGLSPGLLQTTFAVGMKGVKNGDIAELEGTILNVFHDVVKTGFSDGDIEAAMNSIEFQVRNYQY